MMANRHCVGGTSATAHCPYQVGLSNAPEHESHERRTKDRASHELRSALARKEGPHSPNSDTTLSTLTADAMSMARRALRKKSEDKLSKSNVRKWKDTTRYLLGHSQLIGHDISGYSSRIITRSRQRPSSDDGWTIQEGIENRVPNSE